MNCFSYIGGPGALRLQKSVPWSGSGWFWLATWWTRTTGHCLWLASGSWTGGLGRRFLRPGRKEEVRVTERTLKALTEVRNWTVVALLLYIHLKYSVSYWVHSLWKNTVPNMMWRLCAFAAIYLCSLLGHFHQGIELVSDSRQCNLLKQTLLSLSKHHTNQHTEHGWTHVVAGSVGECLLQLIQSTWGGVTRGHCSSKQNFPREKALVINNHLVQLAKQRQGKSRILQFLYIHIWTKIVSVYCV